MSETSFIKSSRTDYEARDLSLVMVGVTAAVLFTGILLLVFFLKPLFHYRASEHGLVDSVSRSRFPDIDVSKTFAKPRLQPLPAEDFQGYFKSQQAVLQGYAWENFERQWVRVPIERAMEMTAAEGLPYRAKEEAKP